MRTMAQKTNNEKKRKIMDQTSQVIMSLFYQWPNQFTKRSEIFCPGASNMSLWSFTWLMSSQTNVEILSILLIYPTHSDKTNSRKQKTSVSPCIFCNKHKTFTTLHIDDNYIVATDRILNLMDELKYIYKQIHTWYVIIMIIIIMMIIIILCSNITHICILI